MTMEEPSPATPQPAAAATPALPADGAPALFPIVGLGASAGGLEAFEQFLKSLPADTGMGFVLVQHLDPNHSSMLAEILRRATTMPVLEAQDHTQVRANHVYVIPPNRDMLISGGSLKLSLPTEPRSSHMPIDAFLRSLADDQGDNAVAIVLSGTGSDGTLGLRAVQGAGGLCLVQDPATAKYDGMPQSALNSGLGLQALPIASMLAVIRANTQQGNGSTEASTQPHEPSPLSAERADILRLLAAATGHDFSHYKQSTIGRRIERRMVLHGINEPGRYLRYLSDTPSELQALHRELLIHVTSFLRDHEAFEVLKGSVLPTLLAGLPGNHVLRVWVAGCATGEEAYSIAMVLRELMDQGQGDFKGQIYSTDIDDQSINTARAGLYPAGISQDLAPERLQRFFVQEETGYRVKKEIREMVVFAVQSVIKDPPFTRIDLLACRNLLIYLEPVLQDKVIESFHYALRPGGVLFLSPSESVGNHSALFEPLHRKWKFYRARPAAPGLRKQAGPGAPGAWHADSSAAGKPEARSRSRETLVADLAKRSLLQAFSPAAVLTDLQGNVLYAHGDTGRYLRPSPGQPSHNVVDMARDGLALDLREALHRAAELNQPTLDQPVTVLDESSSLAARMSVRLVADPDDRLPLLLVSFEQGSKPVGNQPPGPAGRLPASRGRAAALELELAHARESMKAMLEEQQASNEDLKSTNEELQSTNEEMETSKEELQSINEELVTVNTELQTKIEQMASMQDDMKNLLDNICVGTIFLDRDMKIRRYTRDATKVYPLKPTDVGRPLADIRTELWEADMIPEARKVLESLVPIEREVWSTTGLCYLARVQPYRTMDNVIDGVVLTFADVTERVNALAARKARELAEGVVSAMHHPLVVLDGRHQVVAANPAYFSAFGGSAPDTIGHDFFRIANRRWDVPEMHTLLEVDLLQAPSPEPRSVHLDLPGQGRQLLQLSARRIAETAGATELVLVLFERESGPESAG